MTQSEERKSERNRQTVYDEIVNEAKDVKSKPLTIEELRQRLKHIAGLCWGLSVDLANELEEREKLKFENKKLLHKVEKLNSELSIYRNRENARKRYLKKLGGGVKNNDYSENLDGETSKECRGGRRL